MRKKLLLTAIAVFIGFVTLGQNLENEAKSKTKSEIDSFMETIKNQESLSVKIEKKATQQQFLVKKGCKIKYGKKGKSTLDASSDFKTIMDILSVERNKFKVDFTYATPELKDIKLDKKKSETIGYYLTYEIAKCHTKISGEYTDENNNKVTTTSESDYNVYMTWYVEQKREKEKKKFVYKLGDLCIKSITTDNKIVPKTTSVDTLATYVNKIANERIQNWYKTSIPSYFEGKINGDVVTYYELVEQSDYNKKVQKLPTISVNEPQKTVTVTKTLPAVKLHVDSIKYMSPDSLYEKDPNAYYIFAKPSFKITFSDDYKTISNLDVDFGEPEFKAPKSDDMVEVARNKATSELDVFESDFQNKLQAYLKEPNVDNAKAFKSLFKDGTKVEVSIVSKSGNTKRTYSIDQYISRVKGTEISLDMDRYQFSTENAADFNSAYINYTKNYKRDNYCDSTKKKMTLQKEKDGGSYKITEIKVVEDAVLCK